MDSPGQVEELRELSELDLTSQKFWIVRLNGGLGNQMHDFAAGWKNSKVTGSHLVLDLSGLEALVARGLGTPRQFGLNDFRIPADRVSILGNISSPLLLGLIRRSGFSVIDSAIAAAAARFANLIHPGAVREMKKIAFDPTFYEASGESRAWTYATGLHLSFKYFDSVRADLQEIFQPQRILSDSLQGIGHLLAQEGSTAVHVRRGDYVTSAATERKRVTSEAYFRDGISKVSGAKTSAPVVFFSDDQDWCKETFGDIKSAHFVEPNYSDPDAHHLFTMSKATNFVISNSSFSWWAAYLSSSPQKRVVTPKNWMLDGSYPMSDIVLPDWETLG